MANNGNHYHSPGRTGQRKYFIMPYNTLEFLCWLSGHTNIESIGKLIKRIQIKYSTRPGAPDYATDFLNRAPPAITRLHSLY